MEITHRELNKEYWDKRYLTDDISWDIGHISEPLKHYFDQLKDKTLRILIPGAGNSYEAEYLHKLGFQNVFVLDFSAEAIANFKNRCTGFPLNNIFEEDFFKHRGEYDLIIEQTFFCALKPELRQAYSDKMYELLNPGGRLVGLFFNRKFEKGPPFGGSKDEYPQYFEKNFILKIFTDCYNSIKPRMGSEIFADFLRR